MKLKNIFLSILLLAGFNIAFSADGEAGERRPRSVSISYDTVEQALIKSPNRDFYLGMRTESGRRRTDATGILTKYPALPKDSKTSLTQYLENVISGEEIHINQTETITRLETIKRDLQTLRITKIKELGLPEHMFDYTKWTVENLSYIGATPAEIKIFDEYINLTQKAINAREKKAYGTITEERQRMLAGGVIGTLGLSGAAAAAWYFTKASSKK